MKRPEVVVFDMDGTLIERDSTLAFATDNVVRDMGCSFKSIYDLYNVHYLWNKKYLNVFGKDLEEQKEIYKNKLLPALIEFEKTEKFLKVVEFYKNVPELLKKLHGLGYLSMICTSRDTVTTKKILEYYKLDKYISNVIGTKCGDVVEDKPSVKPVHYMMAELELPKSTKIAAGIGDGKKDILMARNLKAKAIAVAYNKYSNVEELKSLNPDSLIEKEMDIPFIVDIIQSSNNQR